MNHSNLPFFLHSDPRRDASASHRGFSFQDLYAAWRWATLRLNEVLVLEGAEDIDIINEEASKAETIQVKDTVGSGAVTLRTRSVLNALVHFHEHKQQNPDLDLRFRYVTTSPRGLERDRPFSEMPGIKYWEACACGEEDLETLRTFLLAQDSLSNSLRTWLEAVDSTALLQDFVRCIAWETGLDREDLRERLEGEAARHAVTLRLTPHHGRQVVPKLLGIVRDRTGLSNKANRRLTLVEFKDVVEKSATLRVDRRTYGLMEQFAIDRIEQIRSTGDITEPRLKN